MSGLVFYAQQTVVSMLSLSIAHDTELAAHRTHAEETPASLADKDVAERALATSCTCILLQGKSSLCKVGTLAMPPVIQRQQKNVTLSPLQLCVLQFSAADPQKCLAATFYAQFAVSTSNSTGSGECMDSE